MYNIHFINDGRQETIISFLLPVLGKFTNRLLLLLSRATPSHLAYGSCAGSVSGSENVTKSKNNKIAFRRRSASKP